MLLVLQCPVAKIIWSVIAKCFGAVNIPQNLSQFFEWCEFWLPGKNFHAWVVAAICWAIWKCRNQAVFDKKLIKSPLAIICHAHSLMIYWSGLYADMEKEQLVTGANDMLRISKKILIYMTTRQVNRILLGDDDSEPGD